MEKLYIRTLLIYFFSLGLVFALDQITKAFIFSHLRENPLFITNFFEVVLVYNKGIAFGMLSSLTGFLRTFILIAIPFLAILVALYFSLNTKSYVKAFLFGMLSGGALGNLYDRIFLGKVRDFLYFHIKNHYWPAFNVADASVSISIVLLILIYYLEDRSKKEIP